MPIIFYCQHCFERVTTPNSTAGKKGRCPYCNKIMDIPKLTDFAKEPPPTAPLQPVRKEVEEDDPFSTLGDASSWGSEIHLVPQTEQPDIGKTYAERLKETPQRQAARGLIRWPGACLLTASLMGVLAGIGVFMAVLIKAAVGDQESFSNAQIALLVVSGASCLVEAWILICTVDMWKLDNWRTAVTAAIFAVAPVSAWLAFTLPFGIWALIVLANDEVKSAFRIRPS